LINKSKVDIASIS